MKLDEATRNQEDQERDPEKSRLAVPQRVPDHHQAQHRAQDRQHRVDDDALGTAEVVLGQDRSRPPRQVEIRV
jgi:hypothetical protein